MNIDYGPVIITNGPLKGRIGYYDDDTAVFSNEKDVYPDYFFSNTLNWQDFKEEDDSENTDVTRQVLDAVIIYIGDLFIAGGYHVVPKSYIRAVNTSDLIKRRKALGDTCGWLTKRNEERDSDDELENLRELHYIDSILVDRMIKTRYIDSKHGKSIFISHSSKDKKFAKWLGADLKDAGHSPWLDEWSIKVGESIPKKVQSGIKESDFMIVILSKNSENSRWFENEWQTKYFNELESGMVQILPVLYESCLIPELLKVKKYADFRDSYSDGLEDVLLAINTLSLHSTPTE